MDPGAVPGGSTTKALKLLVFFCGAETGSTCVIKVISGIRDGTYVLGQRIINANDNFVVANDNNLAVAIAA